MYRSKKQSPLRRPKKRREKKKGRKERKLHNVARNPMGTSMRTRWWKRQVMIDQYRRWAIMHYHILRDWTCIHLRTYILHGTQRQSISVASMNDHYEKCREIYLSKCGLWNELNSSTHVVIVIVIVVIIIRERRRQRSDGEGVGRTGGHGHGRRHGDGIATTCSKAGRSCFSCYAFDPRHFFFFVLFISYIHTYGPTFEHGLQFRPNGLQFRLSSCSIVRLALSPYYIDRNIFNIEI